MSSKRTLKSVKSLASDVRYLRTTLSAAGLAEMNAMEAAIKSQFGDARGRDLFNAIHSARRLVNLVDQYCSTDENGRKMELVIQDYQGAAMAYRVHIACNGSLINITDGAAAMLGVNARERNNRWWIYWNNGRDDLARRLGEMLGVRFYIHVI